MRRCVAALLQWFASLLFGTWISSMPATAAAASGVVLCAGASGDAATTCVEEYVAAIRNCRDVPDAGCESALREPGGTLAALVAATEAPVRSSCASGVAAQLTFQLGLDDLVAQTAQACRKSGEDLTEVVYADDPTALAPEALECQSVVAERLAALHGELTGLLGQCYLAEADQTACNRSQRDATTMLARSEVASQIATACGASFDALEIVAPEAGATVEDRVRALVDIVAVRARHLAQRVYPPLRLGSTASFGPFPVGVRTIELLDPSRTNPVGTGSRPLLTDVYFPSTPEATAGVPLDVLRFGGMDLFITPTHRDVARAAGTFPLVVYAHGAGGIRFENAIKLASLASHGFIVASPERPGHDLAAPFADRRVFENGPRDLRFTLDELLARNVMQGDFLQGAIDPERIGGIGWSFGGYAITTLATGPILLGSFTDPRMKAILSFDGAMGAPHWFGSAPQIFETIGIPTLLVGGDILFSTALAADQQAMFDALVPGASPLGYGVLQDAGHYTFSDDCEVSDEALIAIGGGVLPECGLEAIPWRYARYVLDYLAMNFFAAALNHDPAARARLELPVLEQIEELTYQAKAPEPASTALAIAAGCALTYLRCWRNSVRTAPRRAARSSTT